MLFQVRNLDWAQVSNFSSLVWVFLCPCGQLWIKWSGISGWSWLGSHILGALAGMTALCHLVSHPQAGSARLVPSGVRVSREKAKVYTRLSRRLGSTLAPATSIPFCRPKCITKPPKFKWWRIRLHLFGRSCKLTLQTGENWEGDNCSHFAKQKTKKQNPNKPTNNYL